MMISQILPFSPTRNAPAVTKAGLNWVGGMPDSDSSADGAGTRLHGLREKILEKISCVAHARARHGARALPRAAYG